MNGIAQAHTHTQAEPQDHMCIYLEMDGEIKVRKHI